MPEILVMGLGHAGGQVVTKLNQMNNFPAISRLAVDTDEFDLAECKAQGVDTLLLGEETAGGHGSAGNAELAALILENSQELLTEQLSRRRLFVLVAGLGGGTGRAAEYVLKLAETLLVPAVLVALMPFPFENKERCLQAEEALTQMESYCRTVVIVPNEKSQEKYGKLPAQEAFTEATKELARETLALTTPFADQQLFEAEPGILAELGENGSPRCVVEEALWLATEDLSAFLEKLKAWSIWQPSGIAPASDRAVLLLRVNELCSMNDVNAICNTVTSRAGSISCEVAACVEPGMTEMARLTLLFHADEILEPRGDSLNPGALPLKDNGVRRQLEFDFQEEQLGIFAGDERNFGPGRLRCENLDVPTFLRRRQRVDRGT